MTGEGGLRNPSEDVLRLAWEVGPRPASGRAIWPNTSKALKISVLIVLISPQINHQEIIRRRPRST